MTSTRVPALLVTLALAEAASVACGGNRWVARESLGADGTEPGGVVGEPAASVDVPRDGRTRTIADPGFAAAESDDDGDSPQAVVLHGSLPVGRFDNTYYDFPNERDHSGPKTTVFDASCQRIADVAEGFHDTLCVQGSGRLASGQTVSFAARGCDCARICPRTGQQICFEALEPSKFPWGRGAAGKPIRPLRTLAVDSEVIELGTPVHIREYVGLPTRVDGGGSHDGCFVAEDRGSKIVGESVDVFTGLEAMTKLWNQRVPSHRGVTLVRNAPECRGKLADYDLGAP